MIFKKKKREIGNVAVIDFTPSAKDYGVGGNINKKIYMFNNLKFTGTEYAYTNAKIMEFMKFNVPIVDWTIGNERPKESRIVPSSKLVLGSLELRRVLR